MTLAEATLAAFTLFNGLRLVSYLPQILRILRDPNGASAISYSTWALWCGCHIATGLYAIVNLGDRPLALACALYASCCLTVIGITVAKRHSLRARHESGAGLAQLPASGSD